MPTHGQQLPSDGSGRHVAELDSARNNPVNGISLVPESRRMNTEPGGIDVTEGSDPTTSAHPYELSVDSLSGLQPTTLPPVLALTLAPPTLLASTMPPPALPPLPALTLPPPTIPHLFPPTPLPPSLLTDSTRSEPTALIRFGPASSRGWITVEESSEKAEKGGPKAETGRTKAGKGYNYSQEKGSAEKNSLSGIN